MQKDWETFQTDFRKQKAKFKPVKASDAEKLRKALIDAPSSSTDTGCSMTKVLTGTFWSTIPADCN